MTSHPVEAAAERVARGDVYLCDLSQAGGPLGKRRPALVVQNEMGNLFSTETIVLGIRSGRRDRGIPVLVPVRKGVGGLDRDSVVDAGQIVTLRKSLLGARLGRLPAEVMREVDDSLRISLAL